MIAKIRLLETDARLHLLGLPLSLRQTPLIVLQEEEMHLCRAYRGTPREWLPLIQGWTLSRAAGLSGAGSACRSWRSAASGRRRHPWWGVGWRTPPGGGVERAVSQSCGCTKGWGSGSDASSAGCATSADWVVFILQPSLFMKQFTEYFYLLLCKQGPVVMRIVKNQSQ